MQFCENGTVEDYIVEHETSVTELLTFGGEIWCIIISGFFCFYSIRPDKSKFRIYIAVMG